MEKNVIEFFHGFFEGWKKKKPEICPTKNPSHKYYKNVTKERRYVTFYWEYFLTSHSLKYFSVLLFEIFPTLNSLECANVCHMHNYVVYS